MNEASPARLGMLGSDRLQLGGDHLTKLDGISENRLQLGDRLDQLGHLGLELAAPESREPPEGHVQDVIRLLLAEGERLAHEVRPCSSPILRGANRRDHGVEHVDGAQKPLDDVCPSLGLAKAELGPPRDDVHLVGDIGG